MLARIAFVAVGAILLSSLGAVVEVRALTNAADVIVLLDRVSAEYGETVNVSVDVFDRGLPTDQQPVS